MQKSKNDNNNNDKQIIQELENAKGQHTNLISLLLPFDANL